MQELRNKLQITLGQVIKSIRSNKSISKISNEIDLSKSVWFDVEHGNKDIQLSTFWRIAEALDIKPHKLLQIIENELGDDFSFLENSIK